MFCGEEISFTMLGDKRKMQPATPSESFVHVKSTNEKGFAES